MMASTRQIALWGGTTVLLGGLTYGAVVTTGYTRAAHSCPTSAAAAKCDTTEECPTGLVCTYDYNAQLRPMFEAEGVTTFGHCIDVTLRGTSDRCNATNAIVADLTAIESIAQTTGVADHYQNNASGLPYKLPPSSTIYLDDPDADGTILSLNRRVQFDCQGSQFFAPINTDTLAVNPLASGGMVENCGFNRTSVTSHTGSDIVEKAPSVVIKDVVSNYAGIGIKLVTSSAYSDNTANMTAGSYVLTDSSAPFVSGDLGFNVRVDGATGTGGLLANIASVDSSSQVTLGRVALATVTNTKLTIYRGGNVNAARIVRGRIIGAWQYGVEVDGGDANNVSIEGTSFVANSTGVYESSFLGGYIAGIHMEGNTTGIKIDGAGPTTVIGSYLEQSDLTDINNTYATIIGGQIPCTLVNVGQVADRVGGTCSMLHFQGAYGGTSLTATIPVVNSGVHDLAEFRWGSEPLYQMRMDPAGASSGFDIYSSSATPAGTRLAVSGAANTVTLNGATANRLNFANKNVDHGSISANAELEATFAATGAALNDIVHCSPRSGLAAGLAYAGARVTASDTIAIALANLTSSPIDPAAITWDCVDLKP